MLAEPRYWREMVSGANVLVHYRGSVMLAALTLFGRTLPIHSAGESGNGNVLLSR
jgi:hypothetical protein